MSIKKVLGWVLSVSFLWPVWCDQKSNRARKIHFLRMMYSEYAFTSSFDYRKAPETLGRYFTEPIYKKLRGNDAVGFQYDQGFTFSGNAVGLKEVKTPRETEKFRQNFMSALGEAAKECGFSVKKEAPYEIGICLAALEKNRSRESLPGVAVELYVKNRKTGKSLFLRIKAGSPRGWYEGMKNAWKYIFLILKSSAKNG